MARLHWRQHAVWIVWIAAIWIMVAVGKGATATTPPRPPTAPLLQALAVAQEARLTRPAGGGSFDSFGRAIAGDGNTAVIGAYNATVGTTDLQGTAFVFARTGAMWSLQQTLTASDGMANERFGQAIALAGDTLIIGASGSDLLENVRSGAVYVFTRTGDTWTEQQKLTASDSNPRDFFGSVVALDGDTLVVGAPSTDVGGAMQPGAAYVFTRSNGEWSQQQKLVPNVSNPRDFFGAAVAIDGNTVVVGSTGGDVNGAEDQGAAYVFTRIGTAWSQQQQLLASDGKAGDRFGGDVAVQGSMVVVGATGGTALGEPIAGAAYVFTRNGATWSEQQRLAAPEPELRDFFGRGLALQGDLLAIGAYGTDAGENALQGAVHLFTRQAGAWNHQQRITTNDGLAGTGFGIDLDFTGNTLLVGAYAGTVGGNANQGAAYIFRVRRQVYLPLIVRGP